MLIRSCLCGVATSAQQGWVQAEEEGDEEQAPTLGLLFALEGQQTQTFNVQVEKLKPKEDLGLAEAFPARADPGRK